MKIAKSINEVVQWVLIVSLLVMAVSFNFDFLTTVPERVTELESKQNQQEQRIQSLEQRVSDIESNVRVIQVNKNVSELNAELEELRLDIERLASSVNTLPITQTSTTSSDIATTEQEDTNSVSWYKQRYGWLGVVTVLALLAFLAISTKKRRKKAALLVIPGYGQDQSKEKYRDCALQGVAHR